MTDVDVYHDTVLAGRLSIEAGVRPTVRFQYASTWLAVRGAFAIDPELTLSAAPFIRGDSLFGAMRDSAPDSWGRGLLARSSRGRVLGEADYLLGVSDETRQGALRYREPDEGAWLTATAPVPVAMDLDLLRRAAREAEVGTGPPVRELTAAGAGTGGARPKVVIRDGGDLWIAKFGRRDDLIETEPAEHAIALLAQRAGIRMSTTRIVPGGEPVLLTRRFDRDGSRRLGYLSALSLLEHEVGPDRGGRYDYLDLADALLSWSARPTDDLAQLWRRIAFGAIVRNTDDHMRNHGFVRDGRGWRLSPAFDLNTDVRPWEEFVTAVDDNTGAGRLESLMGVADYFRLDVAGARAILLEVVEAARSFPALVDELNASTWSPETVGQLREVVGAGVQEAEVVLGARR